MFEKNSRISANPKQFRLKGYYKRLKGNCNRGKLGTEGKTR